MWINMLRTDSAFVLAFDKMFITLSILLTYKQSKMRIRISTCLLTGYIVLINKFIQTRLLFELSNERFDDFFQLCVFAALLAYLFTGMNYCCVIASAEIFADTRQ